MGLLNDASDWWLGHIDDGVIQEEIVAPVNALGLDNGGWVPFTGFYASGYGALNTQSGGFGWTPAYRLFSSGRIEFRGIIGKASGSIPTGGVVVATLPAAARPGAITPGYCPCTRPQGGCYVEIDTDGTVNVYLPTGSSSVTWVGLGGIPAAWTS